MIEQLEVEQTFDLASSQFIMNLKNEHYRLYRTREDQYFICNDEQPAELNSEPLLLNPLAFEYTVFAEKFTPLSKLNTLKLLLKTHTNLKMLIIGPIGSGKTTLLENLKQYTIQHNDTVYQDEEDYSLPKTVLLNELNNVVVTDLSLENVANNLQTSVKLLQGMIDIIVEVKHPGSIETDCISVTHVTKAS